MIGLKRGTVELHPHRKEWKAEAQSTVCRLKQLLGDKAVDIQHIGSTSIPSIKAKPIIDIAVAVRDFEGVLDMNKELRSAGFYYCRGQIEDQLLFASGSCYDGSGDEQTHFVHVVLAGSQQWQDYINFRDYLKLHAKEAKAYEALKEELAKRYADDGSRERYVAGKQEFIKRTLLRARLCSYLGKTVEIKIDRPFGYVHIKNGRRLKYPLNYGYIPDTVSGDGEEIDVYLMGVNKPLSEERTYEVKIIGIVNRRDDCEDKLVAAFEGKQFTKWQIAERICFAERFFKSEVVSIYEKSCGAVVYTMINSEPHYLLINARSTKNCGFPKGHMERGEKERQTAIREVREETSVSVELVGDFREETTYLLGNSRQKKVVYFLGRFDGQTPCHNPGFEYNEYLLLPFDKAYAALTHGSAKQILSHADKYIKKYNNL